MSNEGKGCGCLMAMFLIYAVIAMSLGGLCFDYCLYSFVGADIPWYTDAPCGFLLFAPSIPVSIVCLILRSCDIEAPFFGTRVNQSTSQPAIQ